MRKWLKRIGLIMLVAILALPISVVVANWLNPPASIVTDLAIGLNPSSVYGMTFQPDRQTFYAAGRHWIFYINDDSDFVYKVFRDRLSCILEKEPIRIFLSKDRFFSKYHDCPKKY